MDLTGKSWAEFGLKGSGKSTLTDNILTAYGTDALYYDTANESPKESNYYVYRPDSAYSVAELETVINAIKPAALPDGGYKVPKYKLFVIDEANRTCPSKPAPLPPAVADLNDQCRHYVISVGYIARRPSQLNQDLTELADYLFIFRLTGKNDIAYLNNTVTGLGDAVQRLAPFEFVTVYPDRHYSITPPVTPGALWLSKAKRITGRPA